MANYSKQELRKEATRRHLAEARSAPATVTLTCRCGAPAKFAAHGRGGDVEYWCADHVEDATLATAARR